jgi:glycosyltransferase involved in cell wall biosynthesis
MRIAVVSEVFLPAVDGVVTRLRRTLEELQRAGDEVMLAVPAGGPPSYAGAEVVDMPALPMPLYPDGVGYPIKRVSLPNRVLGRALARFQPQLVHVVNPILLGAGAVYLARRNRIPMVASYHANVPAYAHYYGLPFLERPGWRYLRALHNCADLNLCTSSATMAMLSGHGIERLALWEYGVDEALLAAPPASREWRARLSAGHPDRPILLFVGRLAKEKSIERLLPTMRELGHVSLAIVGDGPLRGQLKREFAGTNTTFLGFLTGDDLIQAYSAADVFVFPSQTETLGMVMLEAHAAGLPVVAADSSASRELVKDGVDGMRFDAADPHALTRKISELLGDASLRQSMAEQAGRSLAGATWERATQRLRQHYAQVLAARGVGRAPVAA